MPRLKIKPSKRTMEVEWTMAMMLLRYAFFQLLEIGHAIGPEDVTRPQIAAQMREAFMNNLKMEPPEFVDPEFKRQQLKMIEVGELFFDEVVRMSLTGEGDVDGIA